MGPPLQDFLGAFEPSDWVFPVAHSANCCVQVQPTSEAAYLLNLQFNRVWNGPAPFRPKRAAAGDAGETFSPFHTLEEFIAHAKANPGTMSWASPGIGTVPHLAGELFKHRAGIEMTHWD